MTDDEIVKLVWEVMVLKRRFEDDPYSLSVNQIELLKDHENFLHCCRQNPQRNCGDLNMSDDQIINLIWGVMELEQKFEDDPYSLSLEEIEILQHNEKYRVRQWVDHIHDALKVEHGGSRPFLTAQTHHIQKEFVGERIKNLIW